MHFQLVDIRSDVVASYFASQCCLLDCEECCGECSDAACFQDFTDLKTFPGAGDFDADSGRVKIGVKGLEEFDGS